MVTPHHGHFKPDPEEAWRAGVSYVIHGGLDFELQHRILGS